MIRATYLGVMIEFDAVPEAVAFARTVALPSFQTEHLECIPPATVPRRATKPARKSVTPARVTKKPTCTKQDSLAPFAPGMGGVSGRVLSALRARGTATTREIAEARGCTISSASASLQALAKKGYCTLAGRTWTAVPQKAAVTGPEFETVWNGTMARKCEVAALVAPCDRKAG